MNKDKYRIFVGCLSRRDRALKEMEEFGDEVHICAEAAFKHKKMTKQEFQETVTAARDEWTKLFFKVKEYEEQAEYLARLTGQISFND